MRKLQIIVVAFALVAFGTAQAEDTVTVERHTNPAGTIVRDTVGGALAGSAVSGVIIGYEMGIQNRDNYDWGRTLAWGAVIGAGVGLVWGIVDATSAPSYAMAAPLAPVHDGNSMTLDVRKRDQSHQTNFGLIAGHF